MLQAVVWDFDWSMLDENSDTFIIKELSQDLYSQMRAFRNSHPVWTDLMGHCFERLRHDHGVLKEQMEQSQHEDVQSTVRLLHQHGVRQFIVSDANSVFIDVILKSYGFDDVFDEKDIYTNPAYFDDEEQLIVSYYHLDPHGCDNCSRNMCKDILADRSDAHIVYVGDGRGDYCPTLSLESQDSILARQGYPLLKKIMGKPDKVRASVVAWENGTTILDTITRLLESQ